MTVLEASDTIGGGTRSSEMIVPGLVHDHCSAVHPIAAASPYLSELDLTAHGLTWLQPAVDCVHPLDDGTAGVMYRSLDQTVDALAADGQPVAPACSATRPRTSTTCSPTPRSRSCGCPAIR